MDLEDLEPRKTTPKPRDLDSLSIQELRDYIAGLEAEILRAREKIAAKEVHLSGAASLFKQS
jgi:uncharacterized small protein (DUF1192 family)